MASVQTNRVFRSLYKRPAKALDCTGRPYTVDNIRQMMLDKCTDPELTEAVVQRYIELEAEHLTSEQVYIEEHGQPQVYGHSLYNWSGGRLGLKPIQMSIPSWGVRAIITALTECMPQPVQMIRQTFVHSAQTNVEHMYSPEAISLLNFAMYFCTPYAQRKITAEERQMTGRVYERSLYRTTDMGQGGRRFSDADRSDIISRAMLMAFCPLILRSVPLTDKGSGYVVVRSVVAKRTVGTKLVRRTLKSKWVSSVQSLQKKLRTGKITEQEYSDGLSSLKVPNRKRAGHTQMYTDNGFWIEYTCTETGQKFTVFTQSASRAEHLYNMNGFIAESSESLVYTDTSGEFGESGHMNTVELSADSVFPYRPEGVYFRALKHVTRNLYRYLFRRTDHDGVYNEPTGTVYITEHRITKMARKNFSLGFDPQEFLKSGVQMTPVQTDVLAAELTLPEDLPKNVHHRDQRVQMYRDLYTGRTGKECTITREQFKVLAKRMYTLMIAAATKEKETVVHPAPEPVYGYNPQFLKPMVKRTLTYVPNNIYHPKATSVLEYRMNLKTFRKMNKQTGKLETVDGLTVDGFFWSDDGFTSDQCTGDGSGI